MKYFVLFLLLFIVGCEGKENIYPDRRITPVVRILEHDPSSFTFFVKDTVTKELHQVIFHDNWGKTRFFADVPAESAMYVLDKQGYNGTRYPVRDLDIHIHSEQDINGAGWNHGKFGRGQTEVIQ